jgi:predicted deacylase
MLAGPALLPAITVAGVEPGPTLLVVAGIHGDEYEGMAAIRRVAAELDPAFMRGQFVAIPVANPFAYEARARIAPLHIDGLNLARVFPGDPEGSPSRQLAAKLLDLVLRSLGPDDLFLDFHSGSADVEFAQLIGFRDVPGPATERAENLARCFGIPQLWRIPDSPGPFNAETARRGIVTLGTETTGRAGCDPADVEVYAQGLRNLLGAVGIIPAWRPEKRLEREALMTLEVNAPATGFFESAIKLHDVVYRGDSLGRIVDLFGDVVAEVHAPASGPIWAARSMPAVRQGELLCYIADRGE